MSTNIPREVLAKMRAKKGETWTAAFFYLMKELHVSAEELLEWPLSRSLVLIIELRDFAEREKKEMKKAKRK